MSNILRKTNGLKITLHSTIELVFVVPTFVELHRTISDKQKVYILSDRKYICNSYG